MFLKIKILINCFHIKKIQYWNQFEIKKISNFEFLYNMLQKKFKYYDNILMNILQKILFNQIIFHLCFWYYLLKNQTENYIFTLIIEFWI